MPATECRSERAFVPNVVSRCPLCAGELHYVHEYGPEIVPNGQRVMGLPASYVYCCRNHGLWRVFGGGKALPYLLR